MTEQQSDAVPEPAAEQDAPVSAHPPRTGRRRVPALVAGGLGLAILAGGGFWASGRIDQADRTSPTRYWVPAGPRPIATGAPVPTVPPNELTGKLLPMPVDHELGPDLGEEGNDFYVSGERAVQAMKDARTGLSARERAERDKAVAEMKLKGLAGRSYTKSSYGGGPVTEIELTQADPQALTVFSEVSKKLLDVLVTLGGKKKDAPAVEGFPQAKCVLLDIVEERSGSPKPEPIVSLDCVAVEGSVLVTFRSFGPRLDVKDAAELFRKQLNHLKSPGESV